MARHKGWETYLYAKRSRSHDFFDTSTSDSLEGLHGGYFVIALQKKGGKAKQDNSKQVSAMRRRVQWKRARNRQYVAVNDPSM
jgi:hypothetical protein